MDLLNLAVGNFNEQAVGTTNRMVKTARKDFKRKCGPKEVAEDTFNFLIASSDPLIRSNQSIENQNEEIDAFQHVLNKKYDF